MEWLSEDDAKERVLSEDKTAIAARRGAAE